MKKIISLLLVLSCAVALFACTDGECVKCVDRIKDGKCDVCGQRVVCDFCVDFDASGKCDVCERNMIPCDIADPDEECVDEDPKDAICDFCGVFVPCEVCEDVAPQDNICDICREPVDCNPHVDDDKNAKCDVCGETIECETHVDKSPANAKCDICGAKVECKTHVDKDPKNARCDVCGEDIACSTHVDKSPKDAKCDVCGEAVECKTHVDKNPADAKCDVCGESVTCKTHKDTSPKDGKCDVCGVDVACKTHVDANKNGKCDVCGAEVACKTCVDADPKNGKCDVCGKAVACQTHADDDKNGRCDVCGADVTAENLTALEKFIKVVQDSNPTFIKTITKYTDTRDNKNKNEFPGLFETTLYSDGSFKMYYEYSAYGLPEADADPDAFIVTYDGTIYYKDGKFSLDNMNSWITGVPAASAMAIKLNLSESAIGKDYELTGMGKELEMYLDADQLKAVLGVDIDNLSAKDEYVTVKVVTDGTNLRSVSISYSTENGDVTIETSYTYNSVVSPFEEIPAKTEE